MPMQFTRDVGLALAAAQNHVRQLILLGMVNRRKTDSSSLMERRSRFGFTFPVMLAIQCETDWTIHGDYLSPQL